MNWIFEVYGDTYNAMLMQNRGSHARPDKGVPARPWFNALGYFFAKR